MEPKYFYGVSGMLQKKQTQYAQFIRVEDAPASQDFNGGATNFSVEKQVEYLQKLADFNKREYGDCSQSLVTEEECLAAIKNVEFYTPNAYRQRAYFKQVRAFLEVEKKRRSCILYTKKTFIKEKTLVFQDGDNYPVPCAKLTADKSLSYAQLQVDMGKEYYTPLRGGISTMVPGRIIEFRLGIQEILKLQFYSDGSCCARIGEPDEWHHNNILLGKFDYNSPFSFSVQFDDGIAYIQGLGERREVKLLTKTLPDTIFISGGTCIVNTWKVAPLLLKTSDGEEWNPFENISKEDMEIEELGLVDLPYAVGTQKNQDKTLGIEKKFNYTKDGRSLYLSCKGLDPDGEIYVNGKKVVDNDDMMGGEWDITKYLIEGENTLLLKVNPRGPEVLYSWHKHQDPYNGWFAGCAYIENRAKVFIQEMQVKTTGAQSTIQGSFSLRLNQATDLPLYAKCYALQNGEETLLCEGKIEKQITRLPFVFNGQSWSTENPYLYDIVVRLYQEDTLIDEYVDRVGFRTVEQREGDIYVNGRKTVLKGALLMQFLPPYDEIPVNHVCPSDLQIVWQALLAKKMGCNTVRMHQLGYGTNDERHAKIFDALGLQVIWITRLIDTVANLCWKEKWEQKKYYQAQIREVFNHPCILMWEGGNEMYLTRKDIDCIYQQFVSGVKEVDDTRLICPVSHLYYANDSYDKGCEYYQDSGRQDEYFRNVQACKEWLDPLVVRSAHTYDWLLGYGKDWKKFRLQDWSAQPALLASKERAYIVSEYAVIGQQNPAHTPANKKSYELADETLLGYRFEEGEWTYSQAYQSLAARYTTKYMLLKGADGLLWCCLSSGANDGTYLKPPIDFYGYPKQAFYALKECFVDTVCFDDSCDVVWGTSHNISPVLFHYGNQAPKKLTVAIYDEGQTLIEEKTYENLQITATTTRFPAWKVSLPANAYYTVRFILDYA